MSQNYIPNIEQKSACEKGCVLNKVLIRLVASHQRQFSVSASVLQLYEVLSVHRAETFIYWFCDSKIISK